MTTEYKRVYWNFEYEGEMHDIERETREQAKKWANEWWEARFDGEPLKNGEVHEDEGYLISFYYDEIGEIVVKKRVKHNLYFEYYHGDFAEHNTY